MKHVYLSGPITGLDFKGATDWRDESRRRLGAHSIRAVSPMRHADMAEGESVFSAMCGGPEQARRVTARDRFDVMNCDAILVNLIGCGSRVSIGTVMEVAWADAFRKPVVLAIEPDNVHNHAILNGVASAICPTLDEALRVVVETLGVYS